MPSIVTHHLFAKDVYNDISKKIQQKINKKYYLVFAQSFDNLFYYKFLTPWKGKEIRAFGEQAQKENINLYFKNIILEIEKQKLENNKYLLAFLYGSICHYILDYHCHPFIFYYTGDNHLGKKYRGLHEKMEVNIDAYLYKEKNKKDLYKEQLADTLLPKLTFKNELIHALDNIYYNTFKVRNMGKIYEQSIKTGNFLLKYGVTDRTGIKKRLYKIKDLLCQHSYRRYEYLSFHVTKFYPEYLNTNHELWNNPADKQLTSKKSFQELYEDAKKETIQIITEINEYLESKRNFQVLLENIGNKSYVTGLPCNKTYTLKYFKN